MDDARSRIVAHLRDGEQLLWVGAPDPRVRFTAADGFLVPFSILWGGFAIFWETLAIVGGAPPYFAAFGIPFVLIGLYLIVGRFIVKRRRKLATVYGLTPTRAIVCTGENSFADSPVRGVPTKVDRSRDGSHVTVIFGSQGPLGIFGFYQNTGLDFFTLGMASVGFFDVAEPGSLLRALDHANAI